MAPEQGFRGGGAHPPPAHEEAEGIDIAGAPGGAAIAWLTRRLALFGGWLMLAAVAVTLVSVTGRYVLGQPVPGDYELVEMICAVGIFLFFPYTHVVNGNICAEFFTSGLSFRYKRLLDTVHDIVFALIGALLTWRLGHGLADKFASGEVSILIRIPLWWAYSVAVLAMALLTLVCAWRVAAGIRSLRR